MSLLPGLYKRERPTKQKGDGAPRKSPRFAQGRKVEGAWQKSNGKWGSHLFPGREFDNLDEYRAARKQRAARRVKWSIQNTSHGADVWQGRMPR